ncbi:hypothetical protein MFKK_00130 [Halopseudomonas aestusnigri]|uniref:helix-turn-helix transcriptional regulator n=1 Tax=Halopseudomonas TaxID=2901189 RepID=UPI0022B6BC05|nr:MULTISPECIES: AlpA family phage regulatory protein [Halopseudomonas]BDX17203.1 hypothetical protein MFKK_00130 [Halopseudomonas aestusnigri]
MTEQATNPARRIMRLPAVKAATGLGRSTIYDLMKAGRFPKGHRIAGSNITGWNSLEVEAWIAKQLGEVA